MCLSQFELCFRAFVKNVLYHYQLFFWGASCILIEVAASIAFKFFKLFLHNLGRVARP